MKRRIISIITILAAGGLLCWLTVAEAFAQDRKTTESPTTGNVLPVPPQPFKGIVNLRAKDSKSDFP